MKEQVAEGIKEEVDKGCEFHRCQASGAFKQKIKGAASKMSLTLFKTLLHSGRNLPLRPPYTKEQPLITSIAATIEVYTE